MKRKRKHQSLSSWIDQKGLAEIAKLLKVTKSTVHYWKTGQSFPKVTQMRAIRVLTRGRVGYAQIIDGKE